jgi:hypothetical protein
MAQSSDPDADAVMGSFDHPEAANDSDAATVLASFDQPKSAPSGKDVVGQVIRSEASKIPAGLKSVYDITLGGKTVAEADEAYKKATTPTDSTAQALSNRVGQVMSSPYNPLTWPGRAFDAAGNLINAAASPHDTGSNPLLADKSGLPQYGPTGKPQTGGPTALGPVLSGIAQGATVLAPVAKGLKSAPPVDAQTALNTAAANSPQSMGAAAAAPNLQAVSPGLNQAVQNAVQRTGGAINAETFARHAEADSLPVKIQLTPGQASQDAALISTERNNRGRTPGLPDLLNDQNKRLGQNVEAIRDEVGPDVHTTNHVEHADTLIQSYKDKAAVADADTSAKYQALKDANGGQFPVDAPQLLNNASSALHKELLFDHAPKAVMSTLGRLADSNNMTFENFESLRTNLARIQRSPTADGNEKAAAGIIRGSMEDLPLQPGAAQLKPLADTARSAAKAQFDALSADPAYKAAVNDEVPADKFIQKYVIGGTRDNVALMKQNLLHDPVATQTMGVAALDHLRGAAGLDSQWNGNFKQAAFNKAQEALAPKLNSLVDPKTAESLERVGNVARYTQFQPEGSFVNNSNTLVGALAEHGATAAENILNAKTGIGGTLIRKGVQYLGDRKAAQETMKPYGGLTRLSDVAKP